MTPDTGPDASRAPATTLAGSHILFIGGGNMAGAMIGGLVDSGVPAAQIGVIEPLDSARQALRAKVGTMVFADAAGVAEDMRYEAIVLAVKPQQARAALAACQGVLGRNPGAVLLSIAAGLAVDLLVSMSGGHRRVVRAMPNTPSLIRKGISGLYAPADAAGRDRDLARAILASTGKVVIVEHENLIDTVTAVSGSGPAYAFYLMEAMIEAGVAGGLDAAAARLFTLHTIEGAALLALESDEPPEILRARVTSPGGTTAAAMAVLEQRQAKGILTSAIRAAAARSLQLSEEAKTQGT